MKLETSIFIIIIIFASELATAQDRAINEIMPVSMNEPVIVYQSQNDTVLQVAYAVHPGESIVELKAGAASRRFSPDKNLYSDSNQIIRETPDLIEEWRERVYRSLEMHPRPRPVDLVDDSKLRSNSELGERKRENKMVSKVVLRETLRFTQERLPEIDKLVRALKLEVSTDMIPRQNAEMMIHEGRTRKFSGGHTQAVEHKLFIKTGVRLPIEGGRFSLLSETEARYGYISSSFSIYLDGQFDNTMGLKYVLRNDIQVKFERKIAHSMDPITDDSVTRKTCVNLIQLVCSF